MIRAWRMLLAVAVAAVVGVGVGVTPAHAALLDGTAAGRAQLQQGQLQAAACNGIPVEAYGYVGCAKSGTSFAPCSWDEAFVIAPNRTIWHAWPNSGGWKEMPNNGRADDMWHCYRNGNGQRQIEVCLNDGRVYYSYYSGGWKGWYRNANASVDC